MKRAILRIIFAGALSLGAFALGIGCDEPQRRRSKVPLEGVKITDLIPATRTPVPPQIQFQILTYELPARNAPLLEGLFDELETKPLNFARRPAFSANGFSAGFGNSQIWGKVAERLDYASAVKRSMRSLIVFDDRGDEIIVAPLYEEQSLFYANAAGHLTGTRLGNGRLLWNMRSWPHGQQRGVTEVEFQCLYRPQVQTAVGRLMGREKAGEIAFEFTNFNLRMSGGDFVILGPLGYNPDEITLSSLLFSSPGPDAMVRVYMILCKRVSN